MSDAVTITIIICATIVILCALGSIGNNNKK